MTKQNGQTPTEHWQSKPSIKSKTLSTMETEVRQQYWDKYKTLSKTIWTESQRHSPRTNQELLRESQDLHLLLTWMLNREDINWAEDRSHLELLPRVWKLVCDEAQIIADLNYRQELGYGLLENYTGNNTLPRAEYEHPINRGTPIDSF